MNGRVSDLAAMLRPYRHLSSNYGPPDVALSTHLPMAVSALAAMGAGDERIKTWTAAYVVRLKLRAAEPGELAGRARWLALIERDGPHTTLANAMPALADGIGAAAFHAAIRAAYAIERDDDADLASALESWEREFAALPVSRTLKRVSGAEALDALAHAPIDRTVPSVPLIVDGMLIMGKRDGFAGIADLVPGAAALDELALAAAGAFAVSGDFAALHLMTGTHAFRVLSGALGNADALMPAFWSAYVAAALIAGALPSLDATTLEPLRAERYVWESLLQRAIAQDDDHVIKATYTARRLDDEIGDPVFAQAAASFLERRGA